jgi:hypothetical protein
MKPSTNKTPLNNRLRCAASALFRVGLIATALTIAAQASAGPSAAATRVVLQAFDDDLQSESMAILNDEFSAAYPAGPRVTRALHQALVEHGYTLVETSDNGLQLSGTVTAAYMMSRGLPTNSVAARYQLVDLSNGAVIASGDASGSDWNNDYAAAKLASAIIRQAFK